nr:Chain C, UNCHARACTERIZED PROTEIN [Theileria parva]
VGYPKVKEEML